MALLLGIVLASTFFAGINIGTDKTAKAALNQQLNQVLVDMTATGSYGSPLASDNWTTAAEKIASINDVDDSEIISRTDLPGEGVEENRTSFKIVGITEDSCVYRGSNLTSGASSLGENETYVWIGSQQADRLKIDDVLTFNYTLVAHTWVEKTLSFQLKVAGFVDLDDTAYALALGQYHTGGGPIIQVPSMKEEADAVYYHNLIIVSWEKTFAGLLDAAYAFRSPYVPFYTEILVFLNREALINPWDIGASQEAMNRIILQISNEVAEFGLNVYSNLQGVLNTYQMRSIQMRIAFLRVALPVFFVAWYVGTTVSDVSFNLRRREIGLLMVKGFSSGQLFRLFLSESLLVGVLGGLAGVGLSFLLSPYFVTQTVNELAGTAPVLTLEIIVLAIIFSTGITLLSTFRPSRRTAKMPAIDALKEYMYIEEQSPYRQKWPLIALGLGSYKICMFIIGIPSLMEHFMGRPPPTSNIIVIILLAAWIFIDSALTLVGPLLFFWGFTKVFIRGSLWFQRLATRAARFLGDLGTLATRNVRRNPARSASIAFLIAMIIGYSFQTIGALASEEDYIIRQVKAYVGADVSVSLATLANATTAMEDIRHLQGVESATLQYSFHGQTSFQIVALVAVEPQEWLSTAYYEEEWFSGNNVGTAFQQMTVDNNTIILERTIASNLDLECGDFITLEIGYSTVKLKVVGFFGPETGGGPYPVLRPSEVFPSSSLWSYVSENLYQTHSGTYASGKILVKLEANANGTRVAAQIRDLDSDNIDRVYSVEEGLRERESNLSLTGTTNIQRIGVIFAVLAASVTTALVALVSMQERKKELGIMSIRGLSFRQLMTILLAENLSIVVFSVVLGAAVGLVVVHGNLVALNTTPTLVTRRMVFPPEAVITLAASLILVFASLILPIVVTIKRYSSRLERIVRA